MIRDPYTRQQQEDIRDAITPENETVEQRKARIEAAKKKRESYKEPIKPYRPIWPIVFAAAAMLSTARAEPPPRESSDGRIMAPYGQSIRELKQPSSGMSCCGIEVDCRPVDVITKDNHYEAFIRHLEPDGSGWEGGPDKFIPVPDNVIIHKTDIPMPVACWSKTSGFYCLTLGSGT